MLFGGGQIRSEQQRSAHHERRQAERPEGHQDQPSGREQSDQDEAENQWPLPRNDRQFALPLPGIANLTSDTIPLRRRASANSRDHRHSPNVNDPGVFDCQRAELVPSDTDAIALLQKSAITALPKLSSQPSRQAALWPPALRVPRWHRQDRPISVGSRIRWGRNSHGRRQCAHV